MKRYLRKLNSILIGFFIIYGIYLLGEFIQKIFHVPIPGNVIGFIIMFLLLKFDILKEKFIKDTAELLIGYLVLFFIPYLVKIVLYIDILREEFIPITISLLGSYVLLLFVSGRFSQYLINKRKK